MLPMLQGQRVLIIEPLSARIRRLRADADASGAALVRISSNAHQAIREFENFQYDVVILSQDMHSWDRNYNHEVDGRDLAHVLAAQEWRPKMVIMDGLNPFLVGGIQDLLRKADIPVVDLPFDEEDWIADAPPAPAATAALGAPRPEEAPTEGRAWISRFAHP
jgi:CheY-like chemotaxis protein